MNTRTGIWADEMEGGGRWRRRATNLAEIHKHFVALEFPHPELLLFYEDGGLLQAVARDVNVVEEAERDVQAGPVAADQVTNEHLSMERPENNHPTRKSARGGELS